ncbi:MAG TPA: hypothetical protein VN736_00320 [Candidatus Limnocylindrales bacterium]|nr:hypothetical protein [Candidatus Limnocylindrales bacterium]
MRTVLAPAALAAAQDLDIRPTVSRVYPGSDGKLVYVPDEQGNVIHDCSHAGYGGGGVPIPTAPVKETVWPVAGDNTANLQAAIDKVSGLPLDRNGFRGAVLLKMGYYNIATPLNIKASGVVLRGEGNGDTGTILIGTGTGRPPAPPADSAAAAPPAGAPQGGRGGVGAPGGPGGRGGAGGRGGRGGGGGFGQPTLIRVAGASGWVTKDETKQTVTDDYVPVGARTFKLASARGFRPGDTVILRRIGNQDWVNAVGMGEGARVTWRPFNVEWDRVVTDVQGNTITVDAPLTCAIEKKWGGGELVKYEDPGRIEKIGIENMRGMSEFNPAVRTRNYGNMDRPNYVGEEYYSDENHWNNFITFTNTKNGWVRNATALHFVTSMVGTQPGTKWITVQDCVSREPVSQRLGGRRFIFALRGQLALVQRCHSDKGRHSFMMGQPTASGNVYLDCTATNPYSSSEPHEQWATGGLYDNVHAPLTARFWKDFIIGWAGANTVFWNCEGNFLVQKPPTAQNHSFGHIGVDAVVFNLALQDPTKEGGDIESLDRHVSPRSLYLTQLRERLGEAAVRSIAAPSQLA